MVEVDESKIRELEELHTEYNELWLGIDTDHEEEECCKQVDVIDEKLNELNNKLATIVYQMFKGIE